MLSKVEKKFFSFLLSVINSFPDVDGTICSLVHIVCLWSGPRPEEGIVSQKGR